MSATKRQKTNQNQQKICEKSPCSDKPSSSSNELEDWRHKAMSLKERQRHVLRKGHLKDITFLVGPEKTPFHAHKMILSFASPVFEAMFFGSLREVGEEIEIPDITPVAFELLLDFIYADDLKCNDENEAFAAWIAADKYGLSHMKQKCHAYLFNYTVTNTNVWTILEHSLFLESSFLIRKCFEYLKHNISKAIKAPSFLDISCETLKKIVLMPSLSISEVMLLRGIVLWAQEKMKTDAEGNLNELLKPFIGHIHFGCMSQLDFVSFIHEHPGVISDSDAIKILKFMTNDKQFSLPQWCSLNMFTRISCERQQQKYKLGIGKYSLCAQQERSKPVSV